MVEGWLAFRIDIFRRRQHAFEQLMRRQFLADGAEVGTEIDAVAVDAMTIAALALLRGEKELLTPLAEFASRERSRSSRACGRSATSSTSWR